MTLTVLHPRLCDLILLHFAACSNPGFFQTPARFLSWDHRQTRRGHNQRLKHKEKASKQMKISIDFHYVNECRFTVCDSSANLVLSELPVLSLWLSCRRHTQAWMARTASSSPHCTGVRISSATRPPSWWVVQQPHQPNTPGQHRIHKQNMRLRESVKSSCWLMSPNVRVAAGVNKPLLKCPLIKQSYSKVWRGSLRGRMQRCEAQNKSTQLPSWGHFHLWNWMCVMPHPVSSFFPAALILKGYVYREPLPDCTV